MAPPSLNSDQGDPSAPASAVELGHIGAPEHRYCTECLVTGQNVDRNGLRAALAAIGSSVVVVGSAAKARLHVHVNDPVEAFGIARRFGKVSSEKADDMIRQERSLAANGRRVAIVADSGADMPRETWDDYGIQMVPLRVNFGDESYLDKVGMSAEGFFQELARNPVHPKTSQPPPGDFRRAFELLSSHFEHVVAVSLTGRLSGTMQAAMSAATRISKPEQVTVVDSRNVSVGMGLVVLAAAEAAWAKLPKDAVLRHSERAAERTRTYGAVPDLSYAVRGGRIRQPWRSIAGILPLSFLLSTDAKGGVKVRGVMRRSSDRIGALVRVISHDRLLKSSDAKLRFAIAHTDIPEAAAALETALRASFDNIESVHIAVLGPAYGVHAGPGALAVGVQEYEALASST
jgi:hypothetical protein